MKTVHQGNGGTNDWHPDILPGTLHIWHACIDLHHGERQKLEKLLSTAERAKANRYHFEKHRNRFICGRGITRTILGKYLGIDPAQVNFQILAHGKPGLASIHASAQLCFNLSHANERMLLAVTPGVETGIDLEYVRDDINAGFIAERFFSKAEIQSIAGLDPSRRTHAFFQIWTRKEAYIKATGKGLSFPVQQLDLSNFKQDSWTQIPQQAGQPAHWYGMDIDPGAGTFAAALVTSGKDHAIAHFSFNE